MLLMMNIYILTINKINVYSKQGKYLHSISITVNASNILVMGNHILLFVLGDKHVLHLIDQEGKEIKTALKRNQALRLCKANPFICYNHYWLFAQGRSNDILAYNITTQKFEEMKYLSSDQYLSIEEEASLIETATNREMKSNKPCFDGLSSTEHYLIFGTMEGKDVTIWVKDCLTGESNAYAFASIENDITFSSASSFFYDNTSCKEHFLSYIMPYRLDEAIKTHSQYADTPGYKKMELLLNKLNNVEEANPILIEYDFK